MKKPVVLGITGGIGSGKSIFTELLKINNIPIYDCDSRAKRIMNEHVGLQRLLSELVGENVFPKGKLNKKILSDYLFASKSHIAAVNAIVHPCVLNDFKDWIKQQEGEKLIAVESAILYEAHFDAAVDYVIMVYAPKEMRIQRVMQRDQLTHSAVLLKMGAQQSDEDKKQKADYVIYNDECQSLIEQFDAMLSHFKLLD